MTSHNFLQRLREGSFSHLRFVDIRGADLSRGRMKGVTFEHCSLRGTDFSSCDLENAVFLFTELDQAQLSNCTLEKVRFEMVSARNSNFSASCLDGAHIIQGDFKGAGFSATSMKKGVVCDCNFDSASFVEANLTDSGIHDSNCDRVDFGSAHLAGFTAAGSSLAGASFVGAQRFWRCREVIHEILYRKLPTADVEDRELLTKVVAAVRDWRDWCYENYWRDYVSRHPIFLDWALDVFAEYPDSGFKEAFDMDAPVQTHVDRLRPPA